MTPEDLAQQSVTNLAGLIILTLIPVVAFALWCDYVERYLKTPQTPEQKRENPIDNAIELYRIRSTSYFVTIFQIILFYLTTPIRREYPAIAYPLFMAAVLIQFATQKSLEGKVRGLAQGAPKPDGRSEFVQAFKTFFWTAAAGGLYIFVLVTSVFAFSAVGVVLHAPVPVQISLLVLGMSLGVAGGLSLNFALSSLFVRKIMGAKAVTPETEPERYSAFKAIFDSAGAAVPDFWIADAPQFHLGSVMMAGFPNGKGVFQPGFFFASELLEKFSPEEIRAIVLHEISHLRLRHIKRRFTLSFALISCASLLTGMTVLLARSMDVDAHSQGVAGCITLIVSFFMAFRTLARQVKFQELAADIHSVEKLGSQLPALTSALRKLDRLQGTLPGRREPGSLLLSLGHPETERRILILEKYFERLQESPPSKTALETTEEKQKAA